MYRSIFIDLDDTVWAFTENARDTFQDMYDKYHFDRYFRSFSHFYTLYSGKNEELWNEYGAGRITKDELNEQRFAYPLLQVGVADKALVKAYSDNFFDDIVYKKKLMPHAREALEYLASLIICIFCPMDLGNCKSRRCVLPVWKDILRK